jgi:hypothetical protein
MQRKSIIFFIYLTILIIASTAYAYEATPVGYYLPKGYKVTAKVSVPSPPFWGGEKLGDIVGVSVSEYSVFVVGYGAKWIDLSGLHVEQGVKVVWKQGGREEVKAKVSIQNIGEHDVTIVYDYDGQIKISVDGKFIYGFVATDNKYQIIAQGASVNAPQVLPTPDTGSDQSTDTGSGYNPPSVSQLQMQYLLLGGGAIGIIILSLFLMRRRR